MAVLVGGILGLAPRPAAAWGMPYALAPVPARSMAPDQTWLQDLPERAGGHSKGRVAVFVIKGDDVYEPVRAAVVKTLRRKGLSVTASLQPVDSAAQYREMSSALHVAVFVDGDVSGEGERQNARIRLRSGVTGQPIGSANFSGPTPKIVGDVGRILWKRLGSATIRACSSAARPRRREREPMRIDAGASVDDGPAVASQGT